MHLHPSRRPTIGFISTWPIYQGTTIDRYAHSLIQGLSTAARHRDCDLLLGCGFSVAGNSPQRHSFWPVPGPNVDFVPVGPWNTDGLIIVPDDLSPEQSSYVNDLLASGFPLIFTTPEGPGPVVAVDNPSGIRQAVDHLLGHGHRQIAFIAGHSGAGGDSEERLRAFRDALHAAGLPDNPALVAYGEHRQAGGAAAIQHILATGQPFTALIASNDLSCLGAIQHLSAIGRRIPEDVAVIGFDDILDARSHSPALTTVRHPTFEMGYQAVMTLLEYLHGQRAGSTRVIIPPRLIVRQSCGCQSASPALSAPAALPAASPPVSVAGLAEAMSAAVWAEARHSAREDVAAWCARLIAVFVTSLAQPDVAAMRTEIQQALAWAEERGEEPRLWEVAVAFLQHHQPALLTLHPQAEPAAAARLLECLQVEVADHLKRQPTRAMLAHMALTSQLGMMTAELLTALDVPQSAEILARHLPHVGIENALVSLYQSTPADAVAHGTVLLSAGLPAAVNGRRFEPRQFPLRDLYPRDTALQLTILPLNVDGQTTGFVAFSAANPELCAAIVHNLTAVLRASRLYQEALDGRRLAEEANQLKSRFLSMVSHELRTPLSLIVGLSEMALRDQRETGLAPRTAQDIEQINLSAQHLGRLLGDVLDLASSEAGQLRMLCQPLDLAEVLRPVAATGEQMARDKGLDWQAALPAHGPRVFGDRTRLRQIVLNLISNAVKFTPAGAITLSLTAEAGQVTVAVADTGIGIAPGEQELIFQEFHRTERSVREGYGGLGLGLAVCRQLARHHGGTITVASPLHDDHGTRVSFTLPVMPDLPAPLPPPLQPAQPAQTVVLLVGPAQSESELKPYLEQRGFDLRVFAPDSDPDWLDQALTLPPAAIVMDEDLAARSGWQIMSLIQRQPLAEPVPVLVYTLKPGQDQGELLELNYLLKPLGPEALTQVLERYGLGSHQSVLVVDDDPSLLAMHSRIVQQAGYQVRRAQTGREALASVARARPDLILLDLIMPEMDGFEVLERLREQAATRAIPVIVVTGQVLSEADLDRLSRGVAAILGKGLFTAAETLSLIEAALSRHKGLSTSAQRFVRGAIAFIHTQFAQPIGREEIARHIGISVNYLTECFQQVLGVTPTTYLGRYRIRQAQQRLESTDLSITEIALETGFAEISPFTRAFKREVGLSPSAYRRGKRPAPHPPAI